MLLQASSFARRSVATGSVCVFLWVGSLPAVADEPHGAGTPVGSGVAPPVEELVARALANAPSIAAKRARLEAARLAVRASDVPPDPQVEFEFRDGGFPRWTIGSDPMSMIGASIRQPLLTKGRQSARREAATAEADVRHAETDQAACDLTIAVRTAYGELYAIDRERSILNDSREIASLLAETAMARYASGGADQASVLRAQLEQTRLSERTVDLDAKRTAVVVSINRLLNQPPDAPLGEVRELPDPPPLVDALTRLPDRAARLAPEVSVRQADVAAAARRVEVVREELRPSLTVGGGVYWQGGTDRIVSLTLGVEWPWRKDRKQAPLLASTERELEAARHDLEDAAAGMRAEAAQLVAEVRRADDQIDRYRAGLLPQSSAAFDASRASYLGGRGDFSSVLDEFRRWVDTRVELARREASRFAVRGWLDVLVNPAEHGEWGQPAVKDPASPKEAR